MTKVQVTLEIEVFNVQDHDAHVSELAANAAVDAFMCKAADLRVIAPSGHVVSVRSLSAPNLQSVN